jgi:mRNA-degrading endonuclease toxin of MazEF toxin-antitoxin module
MSFIRGDIYWIIIPERSPEGRELSKTRPCIILTANLHRSTVVVVPLTTGSKEMPPLVVGMESVSENSRAVCDQILAIDIARIGKKIGQLSKIDLQILENSLRKVLGL